MQRVRISPIRIRLAIANQIQIQIVRIREKNIRLQISMLIAPTDGIQMQRDGVIQRPCFGAECCD